MGHTPSHQALALRWAELRADPNLRDRSGGGALLCETEAKTRSHRAAGAVEVRVVSETGDLHVFDTSGARAASRDPTRLNLPPPTSRGA